MKLIKKLLRTMGFHLIQSQLLLLVSILFVSGFTAMVIIYYGMHADATTIDLAGRQRMLTQKAAKEALLVQVGLGDTKTVQRTIKEYETAMQWLIVGNENKDISPPATQEIRSQLEKVHQFWLVYRKDILLLLEPKQKEPTKADSDTVKQIFQRSNLLLRELNKAVEMMASQSNVEIKSNMWLSIVLISTLLLLSGFFYLYVNRLVMKPLLPLREGLKMLSTGDLTVYLPKSGPQDEIGMLYNDYNKVLKDFSSMLSNVVKSSELLGVSSVQLKKAAEANSKGMDKQYQEIEMISTAMDEISATVQEVANSSANASNSTKSAQLEAISVRDTVTRATASIDELNQDIQSVGDTINLLNDNSLKISKILDVINEIAEQTNLLALNAAIEAARAGESGRGFAVVADEVRGLAARTAKSTHEIQKMVEKLQAQAKESVTAIITSQEKVTIGVEHMHHADAVLERIVEAVMDINEMNTHIASATKEESEVARNMSKSIVHIADTSHETRTNAENNRELAEHLYQIESELRKDTARFAL